MIKENQAEFDKLNITYWWDKGFTGKGVNVVVLDVSGKPFEENNIVNPLQHLETHDTKGGHKTMVCAVLREMLPEANIFAMRFNSAYSDECIDWIIENKDMIDVINCSFSTTSSGLARLMRLKDTDIPIMIAVGNDGDDKLNLTSNLPFGTNIGAWQEYGDTKTSYSNYGKDLDFMAYSHIKYKHPNGNIIDFSGTSCSAPVASALIALYAEHFRKQMGRKMTRQEAFEFQLRYIDDKKTPGRDEESGYGLLRLPDHIPKLIIEKEPSEEDTTPTVPDVPVIVPPEITNVFRVMLDWNDWSKQIGEFSNLEDAKKLADQNPGYKVFDPTGYIAYESQLKDEDKEENPMSKGKTLIIDPGHGGTDVGASQFGYLEKDLNLVIAKRVRELLKSYNPAMTRVSDITLDPTNRTNMIKGKYDYCLSLHLNAGSGNGRGIEAIHSINSSAGKALATSIVSELQTKVGVPLRPRSVYTRTLPTGADYYYMHRDTGSTITVIVESLFIDSSDDIQKLNIELIAQGIANGFIKYIGGQVPTKPAPVTPTPEPIPTPKPVNQLVYTGYLAKNQRSDDVKNLQIILKNLGFLSDVADGIFGNNTLNAVKNFQIKYGLVVDGIAGQGTREKINEVLKGGKVSVSGKYKTSRAYDTNIHIYELSQDEFLDVDLGERFKLERVSTIVKNKIKAGKNIVAGINAGFFNFNGSSEHLGLYIDEGLYYTQPSVNFIDFIYYKNGKVEIRNMQGYDKAELSRLQADAHWAIGTSYSLVQNGKINLENTNKFDHSGVRNPRTMLGHNGKNFILAVADGRVTNSKGLTASQQAQVMLSLGCTNAVNLDGGGSSTLVVVENGVVRVKNRLSGGSERAVGSVLIVERK